MSAIKVNYFDAIKNKRTSTTINRNIALCFCISSRAFDFASCKNHDYFLARSVQDFINANPHLCNSKSNIEYYLLTEIKGFAFDEGFKRALSTLDD